MKRTCIGLALLLIAGCTPRDTTERAVAACQRDAAGPVAQVECFHRARQ